MFRRSCRNPKKVFSDILHEVEGFAYLNNFLQVVLDAECTLEKAKTDATEKTAAYKKAVEKAEETKAAYETAAANYTLSEARYNELKAAETSKGGQQCRKHSQRKAGQPL